MGNGTGSLCLGPRLLSLSPSARFKMAAATPNQSSAVNLHPDSLQGSENREDRPKPAQLARDRRLESTTGKYKRRGTSNVTNVHRIIF